MDIDIKSDRLKHILASRRYLSASKITEDDDPDDNKVYVNNSDNNINPF